MGRSVDPDDLSAPMSSSIKIWHQSLTDLSAVPIYRRSLSAIAGYVAQPSTHVDFHGVTAGTFPEGVPPIIALRSRWIEQLLATQLVKNAVTAEAQGYDAVTVSCFFDPGLEEARELVGIPIVSACETSLIVALSAGSRAILTTLDTYQAESIRRVARRHGLEDRVAAIVPLSPEFTDIEIEEGLSIAEIVARHEAAIALVPQAEGLVLIPAEGVLNTALSAAGVQSIAGLPVVDSFASLVAHAEMVVRLQRTTGMRRRDHSSGDALRKHIETVAAVALVRS